MMNTWTEVKLKDATKIVGGYAFKSKDFIPNDGVPVIKIKSLKDRNLVIDDGDYIDQGFLSLNEKYHIKYNDILIALTGSHITLPSSAVGRVAKSRHQQTLLLNQRVGKFQVDPNVCDHDFLYYFLVTDYFFESVGLRSKGAANQANISAGDVGEIKLKLPPLPTQRKIAAILSAYDDLIENNLKRIKLLEEKAQLTYEEWFVRMKFPGHESTLINKETGLPEGWEKVKLLEIGEIVTGKTPSTSKEEYYNGNIPFIKTPSMSGFPYVTETSEYLTQKGADTQKNKYLPKNSLVVSCIGSAGAYALVAEKSQFNQQINAIKFSKEHFTFYTYCFAKSLKPLLEALGSNGATMTNVNKGKFEKIEITRPDDDLLKTFHKSAKLNFEVVFYLMKQNQLLKEARDILLPRLMTGMIDVEALDLSAFEQGEAEEMLMAAEPEGNYLKREL